MATRNRSATRRGSSTTRKGSSSTSSTGKRRSRSHSTSSRHSRSRSDSASSKRSSRSASSSTSSTSSRHGRRSEPPAVKVSRPDVEIVVGKERFPVKAETLGKRGNFAKLFEKARKAAGKAGNGRGSSKSSGLLEVVISEKGVDATGVRIVLASVLRDSAVGLEWSNVKSVLRAALFFRLIDVLREIDGWLDKRLRGENALEWHVELTEDVPQKLGKDKILLKARSRAGVMIMEDFEVAVARSSQLPSLKAKLLEKTLASSSLTVESEDIVVAAVKKWVSAGGSSRAKTLRKSLVGLIRWDYVSADVLESVLVEGDFMKSSDRGYADLVKVVAGAMRTRAKGSEPRVKPRESYALFCHCDFESKSGRCGVCNKLTRWQRRSTAGGGGGGGGGRRR